MKFMKVGSKRQKENSSHQGTSLSNLLPSAFFSYKVVLKKKKRYCNLNVVTLAKVTENVFNLLFSDTYVTGATKVS